MGVSSKINLTYSTTQKRLHRFFFLMFGVTLFLCILSLTFCFTYTHFLNQTFNKLNSLNDFHESMLTSDSYLRLFIRTEDIENYTKSTQLLLKMRDSLDNIDGSKSSEALQRELLDLKEMTDYLSNQTNSLRDAMDAYYTDGNLYFGVDESYRQLSSVYSAMNTEYLRLNELILDDIQSFFDRNYFKVTLFFVFFILLFIFSCITILYLIQNLSKSISDPIAALTNKARDIKKNIMDDAPIKVSVKVDQELGVLIEVFNSMVKQVKRRVETIEENSRIKQELLESRFKELQMQINPHFMFNTLNMIAGNAYFEKAEKTGMLLETAAKIFRFSLDFSGKIIPLYRELEELGNYVLLQEQRFGERIQFQFTLDETFHSAKVPALILQPLVENSIVHGIGKYLDCAYIMIITRFDRQKHRGYISVEDNGVGMDEVQLCAVKNAMYHFDGESSKIGLGNVYMRLKGLYKEEFVMNIESRQGGGTKVIIQLPYYDNE